MIKIEADEREINALMVLIDAAVKTLGIRGAGDAVAWVMKLEAAVKEARASKEKESDAV